MNLPPIYRDQRKVDQEQLKLIAIFHYVFSGLFVAGTGFIFLHYAMFSVMGELQPQKEDFPDFDKLMGVLIYFYVFMGIFMVLGCILNFLSARWINRRKNRIFCIVVAALNCLGFPLGTALGIFTIWVLNRDSVIELYTMGEPEPEWHNRPRDEGNPYSQ